MKLEGGNISIGEFPSKPLNKQFIPCLVTNSKLIPTLCNGNRSYVNEKEVIYDPTKGFKFIIPIPLGSIQNLECKIDSPKLEIIRIEVNYFGELISSTDKITTKDGIRTHVGISITNSHPKEGDNVTIYCTAEASFSTIIRISHKTMDPNGVTQTTFNRTFS
jgi:hypothetical protein